MSRDLPITVINRTTAFGSSRVGLSFALGALGLWGCVREQSADLPVPGVVCGPNGSCIAEQPDRRSTAFLLAPECGRGPALSDGSGICPQRMTLTANGRDVLLSGMRTTLDGAPLGTFGVVLASFNPTDGCPHLEWQAGPQVVGVSSAAHLPGRNSTFYAFAGDAGATEQVVLHAAGGWSTSVLDNPAARQSDMPATSVPNAVAARLRGDTVVVVRTAVTDDPANPDGTLPIQLEWLNLTGPSPALDLEVPLLPPKRAYQATISLRGQIRLFPALDAAARAEDRVVLIGDLGEPMSFSRADPSLQPLYAPRPLADGTPNDGSGTPNLGEATILLPLRKETGSYAPGSVLFIGGGSNDASAKDLRRMEIFDPTRPAWTSVGALPRARRFGTAVLLPDGRVLIAGGDKDDLRMLYVDPRHDFAATSGRDVLTRERVRGVGGLVLADGRVVIAGGRVETATPVRAPPDMEVWEPPYLELPPGATRPAILSTPPEAIQANVRFSIQVAPAPEVVEVVLLAYGSTAFGNDLNQRLVELEIDPTSSDPSSGRLSIMGPPAGWAPAGPYLLFALDRHRTPSVGVPVDVFEPPSDP
jgi:Domain of unknown function (DUF1929)